MNLRFPKPGAGVRLAVFFAVIVVGLTAVRATPIYQSRTREVKETQTSTAKKGPQAGKKGLGQILGGQSNAPTVDGLACAPGRNGGKTGPGVTATSIRLAATVVRSGIGSAFLGEAPTAMQAVVDKVNRAGGICGRLLDLTMRDDAWDPTKGSIYLSSFIDQGVFALAVVPSSEGLNVVVSRGDIKAKGIPVVGTDGMLKSQYTDPWVWPVAASTVSSMHIMVQKAYEEGARTFGIVFDKDYKFGVEGAIAFEHAVEHVTKKKIPGFTAGLDRCDGTFCGISAGQLSYSETNTFNSNCQKDNPDSPHRGSAGALPSCDLVALLLDPTTALTWLVKSGGVAPQGRTMGPQPLFNAQFASSCGRTCQDMVVWTSFNPPLAPYSNLPGVADYVSSVRQKDPSIDFKNSFTEGAYLGMELLVDAMIRVGPKLTRQALKDVLDTQTFDFGLGPPLSWSPGNHLGNGLMQAYSMQYQGNKFVNFTIKHRYLKDRWLGEDL